MSKLDLTPKGNYRLFTRGEIKAPLMQFGYGQREKGTKAQLQEDLKSEYSDEVFDIFIEAVDRVIPGFAATMNQINDLWNKDWLEVSFYMPDGVKVTCKPTSSDWVDFRLFDELNITAKVSGVSREQKALILYVTIIHAFDAYVARQVIVKAKHHVLTIHDGYRQHANYAHITRGFYNETMAEIASADVLVWVLSQIVGYQIQPFQGDLNPMEILNAKYSLS